MKISEIEDLSYEQLWVEFLRFSPSYKLMSELENYSPSPWQEFVKKMKLALPHNIKRNIYSKRKKDFSQLDLNRLDSHYDTLQFTHIQFDDIYKPFRKWFEYRGQYIFDSTVNKKSDEIYDLGTIDKEHRNLSKSINAMTNKFPNRLTLVVGIPMYLTHKKAMHQLSSYLKRNLIIKGNQKTTRKPLHGKRQRYQPLLVKLKLLMYKAMDPDIPMLDLGLKVNISKTNCTLYKNLTSLKRSLKPIEEDTLEHAERAIALAANRALINAQYIAERAAQDKFPDSRRTITLPIDWKAAKADLLKAWPGLKP